MPVLGLQKHPASAESALQLIVADYQSALPRTRSGAALAVKACAGHFEGDMLMTALHFLLEHGLADMAHVPDQKATVSEQMMQAGKATATLLVPLSPNGWYRTVACNAARNVLQCRRHPLVSQQSYRSKSYSSRRWVLIALLVCGRSVTACLVLQCCMQCSAVQAGTRWLHGRATGTSVTPDIGRW